MEQIDLSNDKYLTSILKKISSIGETLNREVYLVGGSVRDLVMGRPASDLDFVVNGDAIEFAEKFAQKNRIKKVVSYKRFGTAMVPFQKYHLEFVSARSESYTSESRNPLVEKADIKTDLSRRDFTINTLAIKIESGLNGSLINIFDGMNDLENGIIRTPLEAEQTFFDDPLRILRAVRFAAQLNFQIEASTLNAITNMSERLSIISVERIAEEFKKLLLSQHPDYGLELLAQTNLFPWIIPEMDALRGVSEKNGFRHKDIFQHTIEVVKSLAAESADFSLRLAALLHDIGKPHTKQFDDEKGWTFHGHAEKGAEMVGVILPKLRYSNYIVSKVMKLVFLHQRPAALTGDAVSDSAYRRLLLNAGNLLENLLLLSRADISTKIPGKKEILLAQMDKLESRLSEIESKDKLRNFVFPVNGDELMELMDRPPGRWIAAIKDEIKEAILEGNIPNDHDAVLEFIKDHRERW